MPQARLVTLQPRSFGPAGSELTVEGLAFDPQPVEIRWGGPDGDLLATSTGPDFSVPVTIPDVPAGLYAVVVVVRQPGGGVGNAGRAAVEVTPDPSVEGSASSGAARGSDSAPGLAEDPSADLPRIAFLVVGGLALLASGGLGGAYLVARRSRG